MTTGQTFGRFFGRGARDWASFVEPQNRPLYEAVHARLAIGNGTRLLDVGCGPGGAAHIAAERGARVAGLDASPNSLAVARERVPDGDFRVGDMESLPWPDRSFDAVTGFNSFPFAGNPAVALADVRRVLAPGGKLGLVVFASREKSQQTKIMAAVAALAPPLPTDGPGPFALSAPGALETALAAAGLHLVDRGELSIVLQFPTDEAACRALMSGGSAARAVERSGEERVRQAIQEALQEFQVATGRYQIANRFQFVIAEEWKSIT